MGLEAAKNKFKSRSNLSPKSNSMAYLFFLLLSFVVTFSPADPVGNDRILFAFDKPDAVRVWQPVNDGVMGGRSSGRVKVNQYKNLEFSGNLSLENNGGFASVRARGVDLKMEAGDTIVLRVRGDGRDYNFNLYTQRNLGGYSYRQSFKTTKGEWVEVKLPIDKFVATWRGRNYQNQPLVASQIAGLGILLGDKKPGGFKLEVESISVASE
jgi:NADH dehydrogenase [ubiquinone] 1 alpha subcomplex assembly factor 1